jgi:hypothetical protein
LWIRLKFAACAMQHGSHKVQGQEWGNSGGGHSHDLSERCRAHRAGIRASHPNHENAAQFSIATVSFAG